MSEKTLNVLLALLTILAFALFVALGGDDGQDLKAHAEWMQEQGDNGAWVMW